ncbi:MAG: hypothetical protein NTZ40_01290 [Cyanobacteria bacterium]|nr:hypothetical protein [Cyanobacteriota bacterium]
MDCIVCGPVITKTPYNSAARKSSPTQASGYCARSASPAGQIFIHGHHIGIEQQQQLLHGFQDPAAVGHHQQLLQGAGGDLQQRCLFQLVANLLPTGLALDDGEHSGGVENHPGRPSAP